MNKSIQTKIVMNSVVLVGLALIILGVSSIVAIYSSGMTAARTNMEEMINMSSARVEWELRAYSNIATGLGSINRMSDPDISADAKRDILNEWTARYGLERCNVIDAEGNGIFGLITPLKIPTAGLLQ